MSQAQPTSQANDPAPGERTFLTAEAGIAKEAMVAAWHDAKIAFARGVDPREWTGAHPLIALATAAVGGFAAACAVVPTKEGQALKKLAELQRAIHGLKPGEVVENGKDKVKADEAAARKLGIAGVLSAEVLKAIRPLLTSVLTSLATAKAKPKSDYPANGETPSADTNGEPAEAPAAT